MLHLLFPLLLVCLVPVFSVVIVLIIKAAVKESHKKAQQQMAQYKELQSIVETIDETLSVENFIGLYHKLLDSDKTLTHESKCHEYVNALNKLISVYNITEADEFKKTGTVYQALSAHGRWITGCTDFSQDYIHLTFPSTLSITKTSCPKLMANRLKKFFSMEMGQLQQSFRLWVSAPKYLVFATAAIYVSFIITSFRHTQAFDKRFPVVYNSTNSSVYNFEQRCLEYLFPFMIGWIECFGLVIVLQYLLSTFVIYELWEQVPDFSIIFVQLLAFVGVFCSGFIAMISTVASKERNGVPWVMFVLNFHPATSSHFQIFNLLIVISVALYITFWLLYCCCRRESTKVHKGEV